MQRTLQPDASRVQFASTVSNHAVISSSIAQCVVRKKKFRGRQAARVIATPELTMLTSASGHKPPSAAAATDAVEGGLAQSLGNFFFRSRYSAWLWNTSISAPYRVVRIIAMTLIAWILLARSWRLFLRCNSMVSNALQVTARQQAFLQLMLQTLI